MFKWLCLFLLIPFLSYGQSTVVQQKPISDNPSSPSFNSQTFLYSNWRDTLVFGMPIGLNAKTNTAHPFNGQSYLQLSDSTLQVYLTSCNCWVPFGKGGGSGGGGSSTLYLSGKYFQHNGLTPDSAVIFAPTINLTQGIYFKNNGFLFQADSGRVLNAPTVGTGIVRLQDLNSFNSPNAIINGLILTIPNPTHAGVGPGTWRINNVIYTKAASTLFVLPARDATQSRYILYYATTGNIISSQQGNLSLTPATPSLPANSVALGTVLITPTGTFIIPVIQPTLYNSDGGIDMNRLVYLNEHSLTILDSATNSVSFTMSPSNSIPSMGMNLVNNFSGENGGIGLGSNVASLSFANLYGSSSVSATSQNATMSFADTLNHSYTFSLNGGDAVPHSTEFRDSYNFRGVEYSHDVHYTPNDYTLLSKYMADSLYSGGGGAFLPLVFPADETVNQNGFLFTIKARNGTFDGDDGGAVLQIDSVSGLNFIIHGYAALPPYRGQLILDTAHFQLSHTDTASTNYEISSRDNFVRMNADSAGEKHVSVTTYIDNSIWLVDDKKLFGAKYGDNYYDNGSIDPRWIPDWGAVLKEIQERADSSDLVYAKQATTLTINGTTQDLSTNRSWSVGTVTSVTPTRGLTGSAITTSGNIGLDTTKNYTWFKRQTINFNTGSVTPVFGTQTLLQLNGVDADNAVFTTHVFGGHFLLEGWRANGTNASKTGLVTNDEIMAIGGGGYDGTAYTSEATAALQYLATETWGTSAHGTKAVMNVTPNGSTTLTAAFQTNPDLSSASAGWLGAGQLTGGTNLLAYASYDRGLTIYPQSNASSRSIVELTATGNTTATSGEIDFDNLTNSPASNYRQATILSAPSGATSANQGGTLILQTKADAGSLTTFLSASNVQVITIPHYTTANGLLYTDGSGVISQSTALPNGTTGTTQSAGDNSTKVATTAYVATVVGTPVTAIGITTANGVSGSSSGGTTPNLTIALGAITPTTVNGNTFTTGTYTLTGTAAKTLNFTNSLTLTGTDATTMTFPTTTATIARTDATQTFTGNQTFSSQIFGPISTNGNTTSSNLDVGTGGTIGISSSSAPLLVNGALTISARTVFNGQTSSSIASGNSYTGVEIGDQPVTVAGATALTSFLTVRGGALTISSGSVTDYTTAYFQGRTSGATNTWNGWFKYGTIRLPAVKVDSLLTGTVGTDAIVVSHSGVLGTIASSSVPQNQASADLTAQSAAGNVTTFTVGASTATFNISTYINVTAVAVDVIQGQITYTDENNTAQTVSLANISAIGNSTYNPVTIRAKNGTVITVKTNLTTGAGSITFDTGARITQM